MEEWVWDRKYKVLLIHFYEFAKNATENVFKCGFDLGIIVKLAKESTL